MIYAIIIVGLLLAALLILVWLRKAQYDAVHRNFLDLEDHFGGRVIRGGFAVRPRFSGNYRDARVSISISSEKKTREHPRQFYISVFMQTPAKANFTVMSNDWLHRQSVQEKRRRASRQIADKAYRVEVSEKNVLKQLDFPSIEKVVKKMHPFAYILVSRRGLVLERLSSNLIKDTEFRVLEPLLEGLYELSTVPVKGST